MTNINALNNAADNARRRVVLRGNQPTTISTNLQTTYDGVLFRDMLFPNEILHAEPLHIQVIREVVKGMMANRSEQIATGNGHSCLELTHQIYGEAPIISIIEDASLTSKQKYDAIVRWYSMHMPVGQVLSARSKMRNWDPDLLALYPDEIAHWREHHNSGPIGTRTSGSSAETMWEARVNGAVRSTTRANEINTRNQLGHRPVAVATTVGRNRLPRRLVTSHTDAV